MARDLRRLLAGPEPAGRPAGGPAPFPAAVLTMELQRGVMGDLAAFPELAEQAAAQGLVEAVQRLLRAARRAGLPVVHCTAEFRPDRQGTTVNTPLHAAVLRRPEHLVAGTPPTEVVAGLLEPGDLVSARGHGVSPFIGTDLDALLRNLGVKTVVATGVSVNVAVTGLAIEAANLGYTVVVATDAVAGVPPGYASAVMEHTLARVAALAPVDELVAALSAGPA